MTTRPVSNPRPAAVLSTVQTRNATNARAGAALDGQPAAKPVKTDQAESTNAVLDPKTKQLRLYSKLDTESKSLKSKAPDAIKIITSDGWYFMVDEIVLRFGSDVFDDMLNIPTAGKCEKKVDITETGEQIAPLFQLMVQLQCPLPDRWPLCRSFSDSLNKLMDKYACIRLEPLVVHLSMHALGNNRENADVAWYFIVQAEKHKSRMLFAAAAREMEADPDRAEDYELWSPSKQQAAELGFNGFFRYLQAFHEQEKLVDWQEVAEAWDPEI